MSKGCFWIVSGKKIPTYFRGLAKCLNDSNLYFWKKIKNEENPYSRPPRNR